LTRRENIAGHTLEHAKRRDEAVLILAVVIIVAVVAWTIGVSM
jgi:predicted metal-binding membrane protein